MFFSKHPSRCSLITIAAIAACAVAAPAFAKSVQPTSVVSAIDLQQAVDNKVAARIADRAAVSDLLNRAEVRATAAKVGLDVDRALDKASTLSDDELAALAAQARILDNQIAGGETVVITTTVLTLVLLGLLVLLIA